MFVLNTVSFPTIVTAVSGFKLPLIILNEQ